MSRCQRECHRFEPDILLHFNNQGVKMKVVKVVLVGLLGILATGCASTSELAALEGRVSSVEASQSALAQEVSNCKSQMNTLSDKQAQCDKHCKTLESKLDKVFKKAQYK